MRKLKSLVVMMACISGYSMSHAEDTAQPTEQTDKTLEVIRVVASADASAGGLMQSFAGGQVATGGRVGIFGNQKNLDTPFNMTSYTNAYIQDKQAKSVGDVLKADPSVRVGRGYGNFQENYYIRGFNLGSDDTAYNGLFSLLPRQYIPTELFERVEVFKGASSFLNGATPSNGGIGGVINLLPKRAGSEPLNRVIVGTDFNGGYISNDVSRRFGEDQEFGVRVNAGYHGGGTPVEDERSNLGLFAVGLDYHGDKLRLSGDMGYANNRLKRTRSNVTLGPLVTSIPNPLDGDKNFAQKWTYSNEENVFGSYRAEYDLNDDITAYAAYGFRHGKEGNQLANYTVANDYTGKSSLYRFNNERVDMVNTGELGVRGKLDTGPLEHKWVLSTSAFQVNSRNAYTWSNNQDSNIYDPVYYPESAFSNIIYKGNKLDQPALTNRTRLRSVALGDNITTLNDQLIVLLGVRYQKIIQESYAYDTHAKSSGYNQGKVTPAVGLTYKITPEISVYGNYIESLSKGLEAPTSAINKGTILKPFVGKQKEIGIKYENENLGASMSFYDIDKQRGILKDNYFSNSGKYVHRGVEINSYGKITDSVKILGGVAWLDAKQKNTGSSLYDGKYEVGVPKFQANLGTDWQLPVAYDVSLNAQLTYTGATYASLDNKLKVGNWTTLDLGASYKTEFGQTPTKFNFMINNVFNKDYWSSVGLYDNINGTGNTNNGYLVAGLPRTFSVSATFDF